MSLILEALRKSEAERRRDSAPDLALELPPAPARAHRATPWWLWPVLAVGVALAALGGWRGSHRLHREVATPAPVASTAPPPVGTPRIVPRIEPAQPAVPAVQEPAAAAPARDAPAPTAPAVASGAATVPPVAPASGAAAQSRVLAAAPLAVGTPDIAATALPPVKLTMHMWDADPARRFVILDGQRMGEGDRSGGLGVVAIDRNGVTIERDGQRAHVPLP